MGGSTLIPSTILPTTPPRASNTQRSTHRPEGRLRSTLALTWGGGYLLKSPAAPVREGSIPSQALPAPPAGVAPPEPRPPVFIPPLRLPKPPDPPLELADLWRSLEDLSYTSSSIEDWWPPLLKFGFKQKNEFFEFVDFCTSATSCYGSSCLLVLSMICS